MKIAIFAAIGSKNLGDELILKNEIQYFKHVYGKDTTFTVFTYDVKEPFIISKYISYSEYFPCESKKIKNILRNIKNFFNFISVVRKSDLIVVGGGGIFFDNELNDVSNPLKIWIFRSKIFRLFNKKVRFHSIGITIKKTENLDKIKNIFTINNSVITVRDSYSQELLKSLGIKSEIIADPVFSDKGNLKKILKTSYCLEKLHPKKFSSDDLKGYNLEGKRIGIVFRAGYFWEDDKTMVELIEYILAKQGQIILVPNSYHPNDTKSNDFDFLERYSKMYGLAICRNMGQSYDIYINNKIDICLGMRLHSMILSQVYKIPFIAFSYSKKTDEILKIIGNKV